MLMHLFILLPTHLGVVSSLSLLQTKPKSICGKMVTGWIKVFNYLETISMVGNARLYASRKCSL